MKQKSYIEMNFSDFLVETKGESYLEYKIYNSEPFELIKIYKHLIPHFHTGELTQISINASNNEHELSFTLKK